MARLRLPEYEKIGQVKECVGFNVYNMEGDNDNGACFKDEEIYEKHPDQVCYIPEAALWDAKPVYINGVRYDVMLYPDSTIGYSHNDLLKLCQEAIDNDELGDTEEILKNMTVEEICDDLFGQLEWACPETYLNEWEIY